MIILIEFRNQIFVPEDDLKSEHKKDGLKAVKNKNYFALIAKAYLLIFSFFAPCCI